VVGDRTVIVLEPMIVIDDPDEPLVEVPVAMEVVIPVELMGISVESRTTTRGRGGDDTNLPPPPSGGAASFRLVFTQRTAPADGRVL
jgi:hypothetical protein